MQANALYEPSRNINNGSLLDTTSLQSQLTRANQQSSFFRQSPTRPGFQSLLESPHGNLHVQVGGQMGAVPSSANDPIFWLHHANVDRQWDQWMNSLPGRQLPNDPNFLNQTFRFVDETGSIVTVRAQDILRSDTLGYRYDDVFGVAELVALEGTSVDHQLIATNAISDEAVDASIALPFGETRIPLAFQAGGQELVESIPANPLQNRDGGVFLRVRGIKFKSIPKFVFGVYLNLPEDEKNEQRKLTHFAGTLDLFSATQSHSNPENTEQLARPESDELSFDQDFDLSPIIAQLKQIGEFDATRLEVVILPIAPIAPRAFQEQASADFKASAETANVSFGRIEVLKD
jgi:tyrosinase